jgi:hypothetical protein
MGLSKRISRIDELFDANATPAERAAIARREFSTERQISIFE